jgi:hypothetical protein
MEITDRTFNRWKKSVEPFDKLYAELFQEIESRPSRELKYILKHGDKLTNTNCWWATYKVFPIIEPLINNELKRREYLKSSKTG